MAYRSTDLTRSTAATKRAVFLRAARTIVATRGFSAASVTAIAQESGTSVGLVYSYFENRENLLSEVFRSVAEYEL
ncbi:MAG: TetR/AcrR family transcriptional regulator, partial [Rhodococcus sp. (in: high G+C Gram-positive bacteria)]